VYVISFLALLNARYYTQGVGLWTINTGHVIGSEQQLRASKPQAIVRESTWVDIESATLPDDDVLYPARRSKTLGHVSISSCIPDAGR